MSDRNSNFEMIYAEFQPKVLRYLSGIVGRDEAEDVAQNVFLKVHAGLPDFRGEAALSTWIYRIATNAALDRLRSASFRQAACGSDATEVSSREDALTEAPGESPEPRADSVIIRTEMNECIRAYVDALPAKYRMVLTLSDYEGFKDRDIAEILGLSVEAVKIRLHRARLELKKMFEAGCDFYRTESNEFACDRKEPRGRSHS
jgi:RNA polymerase sigma-70 factor, ECF subfamily